MFSSIPRETDEYANQPPISSWKFVDLLEAPLHQKTSWMRTKKKKGEIDLREGVFLNWEAGSHAGLLDTAYEDFKSFLLAGDIPVGNGAYRISTEHIQASCHEEYIIEVNEKSCSVSAADSEGIRRGLVALEDLITSSGGPFLSPGRIQRKPFIKTRISRCFFGPIKRPPMMRDELMDDVNYYPDEYLNKLAHEGINGLWLSIAFRDICPSRFFPEHGKKSAQQIEKLRQTVRQCARYGIKIYVFCCEPLGFRDGSSYALPLSELEGQPYFEGNKCGGSSCFCTSTPEGQAYLEECTNFIFSNVPGLGGMISITHGESVTSCYSSSGSFFNNSCPRCSKRKPWEVYHELHSSMARGIRRAAPDAEFISWLYAGIIVDSGRHKTEEYLDVLHQITAHTPEDVIMQINFESNGTVRQLGRDFSAYDYWLAWPGPSSFFSDCAASIVKAGARASAKIQVGCSHENATIPFMPVPGSLYRKYAAMKELDVSSVMQCWYFGNYPGLMNKAAGELAFLPFSESEDKFLERLAKIDWSVHYRKVSKAWKYFMQGYSNFPIALTFTWFGPLHCSIIWPLHLIPVDTPIAPSWEFGFSDSGDRIGECICFQHSLDDVLKLLNRMDEYWQKGVDILKSIEHEFESNEARKLDIGLCSAIGCQIRSAKNIFTFYDLREKLPSLARKKQVETLDKMKKIVLEEIENSLEMKKLCEADPRLGFHSEAEGYKFFPAKLEWRIGLLRALLDSDFPKVCTEVENGSPIFPEYAGLIKRGKTYAYGMTEHDANVEFFEDGKGSWKAWTADNAFHFEIKWKPELNSEILEIGIEPRRLWPLMKFFISAKGQSSSFNPSPTKTPPSWSASMKKIDADCVVKAIIPFDEIPWFKEGKPLRINIYHKSGTNAYINGWIRTHPAKGRLIFGLDNSSDLGWFYQFNNGDTP